MHQNKKLIHTGSHNLKEYFTKHKKDKINSKRYFILSFCVQHIMLGCALSAGMGMNVHDWLKSVKWFLIYTFQCRNTIFTATVSYDIFLFSNAGKIDLSNTLIFFHSGFIFETVPLVPLAYKISTILFVLYYHHNETFILYPDLFFAFSHLTFYLQHPIFFACLHHFCCSIQSTTI